MKTRLFEVQFKPRDWCLRERQVQGCRFVQILRNKLQKCTDCQDVSLSLTKGVLKIDINPDDRWLIKIAVADTCDQMGISPEEMFG
jgi:hypothetical protein